MTSTNPFEELYRENVAYVWRSLYRLGCPRFEVADATHDVFLIAFKKLQDFEHRSSFRTWLFGICYRQTLERRRAAAKHVTAAPAAVDALVDHRPDQSLVLERSRQMAALEAILVRLSVEQRAVFTLHELEGLDGNAIAQALGIPKGTVYSRLRAARDVFWKAVHQRQAQESFPRPAQAGSR